METWSISIESNWGFFRAGFTHDGLCALHWPTPAQSGDAVAVPAFVSAMARTLQKELSYYIRGKAIQFTTPVVFLSGTEFQRRVWEEMRLIRWGAAVSYGDMAKRVGSAGATRAVGQACGRNPVPVVVPCHRVLAANGRLGGFSGGIDWKRRLLQLEGIPIIV